MGLHQAIALCMDHCYSADLAVNDDWYKTVVLSGGTACLPGLAGISLSLSLSLYIYIYIYIYIYMGALYILSLGTDIFATKQNDEVELLKIFNYTFGIFPFQKG